MRLSKRLFDLFWACLGLLVLLPAFAVIALAIKLSDRGPVFFRQERVGHQGRVFRIWKFRSMVPDADRLGKLLTAAGDTRITRIGRWLRALKLDELPQLMNVIVGEMSLVGPRPEVPKYVALYDDNQRKVLSLVPGITDPASVRYRHESELLAEAPDPESMYIEQIMPEKIRTNLDYAERASLLTDLAMVCQTLMRILS